MARRPPTTHERRISEGSPTMRATFDGFTKIPTPMMAPATTTVASRSPSSRRNPPAPGEADSLGCMRTGAAYVRGETPVKRGPLRRPASTLGPKLDLDRDAAFAAQDVEPQRLADVVLLQGGGELVRGSDRLAVHGTD